MSEPAITAVNASAVTSCRLLLRDETSRPSPVCQWSSESASVSEELGWERGSSWNGWTYEVVP